MTGFFYNETTAPRAKSVLEALRLYQAAESAMRRRTRESMSMGENELLVVRHLLRAQGRGQQVTPSDVSRYLGISSASTTALLDRLEQRGYLQRVPHPTDRRSMHIQPTVQSDDEVRATLSVMHDRMHEAARSFTPEQSEAIIEFFARMQDAVDSVDPVDSARAPAR